MERGGGRESVADLLRHSLTAKGGNEGCWSGCLCCSSAEAQTDRRASTASLIDLGLGTAAGTSCHRPVLFRSGTDGTSGTSIRDGINWLFRSVDS